MSIFKKKYKYNAGSNTGNVTKAANPAGTVVSGCRVEFDSPLIVEKDNLVHLDIDFNKDGSIKDYSVEVVKNHEQA